MYVCHSCATNIYVITGTPDTGSFWSKLESDLIFTIYSIYIQSNVNICFQYVDVPSGNCVSMSYWHIEHPSLFTKLTTYCLLHVFR